MYKNYLYSDERGEVEVGIVVPSDVGQLPFYDLTMAANSAKRQNEKQCWHLRHRSGRGSKKIMIFFLFFFYYHQRQSCRHRRCHRLWGKPWSRRRSGRVHLTWSSAGTACRKSQWWVHGPKLPIDWDMQCDCRGCSLDGDQLRHVTSLISLATYRHRHVNHAKILWDYMFIYCLSAHSAYSPLSLITKIRTEHIRMQIWPVLLKLVLLNETALVLINDGEGLLEVI